MKKYISILASLLLLAATSCIQETVPGENFVTDDQLASSEIGVKGLMNAVYTTLASVNPFGDGQMSYGAMKQMLDHGTSSLLNPGYNGFNTMLQYSYGNFSYANRSRWPVEEAHGRRHRAQAHRAEERLDEPGRSHRHGQDHRRRGFQQSPSYRGREL